MIILIIIFIYLSGYILGYILFKNNEKHVTGGKWTKRDRLIALGYSFFSWTLVVIALLYIILEYPDKKSMDKDAKW